MKLVAEVENPISKFLSDIAPFIITHMLRSAVQKNYLNDILEMRDIYKCTMNSVLYFFFKLNTSIYK